MLNVNRIMVEMSGHVNRNLPKVTPSVTKNTTKTASAAFDYIQLATTTKQYPLFFNRTTRRLFEKLKLN